MANTNFGVVVVGGSGRADENDANTKNSAEIYRNDHWVTIKQPPVSVDNHCVVQVNTDEIMVIGGIQNGEVCIHFYLHLIP